MEKRIVPQHDGQQRMFAMNVEPLIDGDVMIQLWPRDDAADDSIAGEMLNVIRDSRAVSLSDRFDRP